MREIKFRAWDKKKKMMFPVHELEWHKISNSLTKCVGYDDWDKDGYTMHGGGNMKYANGERYVLMQYTGLCSMNGKEIYEGDIVKVTTFSYIEPLDCIVATISYAPNRATFVFGETKPLCFKSLDEITNDAYTYELEVIGNIYEHPELIDPTTK